MSRRGPISLAARLAEARRPAPPCSPEVTPLWTTKDVMRRLAFKSRSGFDEFISRTPAFPRIKVGNSYRYDPESVNGFLRHQEAETIRLAVSNE